jgi:hypothetical protein
MRQLHICDNCDNFTLVDLYSTFIDEFGLDVRVPTCPIGAFCRLPCGMRQCATILLHLPAIPPRPRASRHFVTWLKDTGAGTRLLRALRGGGTADTQSTGPPWVARRGGRNSGGALGCRPATSRRGVPISWPEGTSPTIRPSGWLVSVSGKPAFYAFMRTHQLHCRRFCKRS